MAAPFGTTRKRPGPLCLATLSSRLALGRQAADSGGGAYAAILNTRRPVAESARDSDGCTCEPLSFETRRASADDSSACPGFRATRNAALGLQERHHGLCDCDSAVTRGTVLGP